MKIPLYLLLFLLISFYSCSVIKLSRFDASDCNHDCSSGLISKTINKNTTIIEYGAGNYCCLKFKGKIKFSDDTLYLYSLSYNEPCKCFCGYEFTYYVKGLKDIDYQIKYISSKTPKTLRQYNRWKKINALKDTDPEKYKRIQDKRFKKSERKYDRKGNRLYNRQERKKHKKEIIENSNDDVYN